MSTLRSSSPVPAYEADLAADAALSPPAGMEAPAPHGVRALAWAVDLALVGAVVLQIHQPLAPAVPVAVFFVYHAAFLWLVQQTPGKAIFGLRVHRVGKKPTVLWALGRSSVGYFPVDLAGLGLLPALRNARHRCLHDYVFSSEVVLEDGGRFDLRVLLSRLERFAERHVVAAKQRQRPIVLLGGVWAFIEFLAEKVKAVFDALARLGGGGQASSGPSIGSVVSGKVAVAIVGATTAATALVVATVPPVANAARWAFSPQCYVGCTPPGLAGTWQTQDFQLLTGDTFRPDQTQPAERWTISKIGDAYLVTVMSPQAASFTLRAARADYTAERRTFRADCVKLDTGALVRPNAYSARETIRVTPADDADTLQVRIETAYEEVDSGAPDDQSCPRSAHTTYQAVARRS